MSWRYGLIKHPDRDWYAVCEVYDADLGRGWTAEIAASGESRQEVIDELQAMLRDISSDDCVIVEDSGDQDG